MNKALATATCLLPRYQELLPIIRRVAYNNGYTIGLHGSGQRDMDLIAVPWIEKAKPASELVERIRDAIDGVIENVDGAEPGDWTHRNPQPMPHGRLAWSIKLTGGHFHENLYVDLSVMPLVPVPPQTVTE